jgi:ABC-type branched-subunit amino acid transport system substrate-binding protein
VGREDITGLIEALVDRRARQPLPIVVALGPGGSGKTALLDHVKHRYGEAPVARVDVNRAGSHSVKDILDVVVGQLRAYSHPHFGRMRLPRYELVRLAMTTAVEPDEQTQPHRRARELVAQRMTSLLAITDATATAVEAIPPAQGWARLLRPLLRRLLVLAVVAPAPLRFLFAGPSFARALRWYDREAGRVLCDGRREGVDSAVTKTWQVVLAGERWELRQLDRLLVDAFLADISSAYRFRRHRRMNCVLLLDGADLLAGVDTFLPPRRPGADGDDDDFLTVLAGAKLANPHVPLLVVATKQAGPGLQEAAPALGHDAWRERFERAAGEDGHHAAAFLTVRLAPFRIEHTRQFLAEWNRSRDSTVETEALIDELQEVTHGHPLAVRLAVQLAEHTFQRDQVVPSVRSLFDERLPLDETAAPQDVTVREYLLQRFLQRFPGADEKMTERALARDVFRRLAAPRRLDAATLKLFVPAEWSAESMRSLLGELSFVDRVVEDGTEHFVLHPLLRDLLALQLREVPESDEFSHVRVHAALRARYETLGRQREVMYHSLALGEVHHVANLLRPHVDAGGTRWVADLVAVARAPQPPERDTATLAGLRDAAVRGMHARLERLERIVSPETVKIERAVLATWRLRSCTGVVRRTSSAYGDALRAWDELAAGHNAALDAQLQVYRRARRSVEDGTPAEPSPPLPPHALGRVKHVFPKVWPRRGSIRRTTAAAVVLLLVAYGSVFAWHTGTHCTHYGPLDPAALAAELSGDGLGLSEVDGQCIGVTDRPGDFTYGDAAARTADDVEVTELSRLIGEQNRRVAEAAANEGWRYVTVVVAAMLSSREENPRRDVSAGVNELRGAYLAQRAWNQFGGRRNSPLVRLRLANLGGRADYAPDVARQIRDLVRADPTVVAVTGMGQSRASTITAAEILGPDGSDWSGIPVVASTLSANDFTGKAYFFRAAPTNRRQGEVAVDFVASRPDLRDKRPFLVYDAADEYSRDLKESVLDAIRGRDDTVLLSTTNQAYETGAATVRQSLLHVVRNVCEVSALDGSAPSPLILYTGRASELAVLVTELTKTECGDSPVVLGGDDLSQLETVDYDDLDPIARLVDQKLFFTTFGRTPGTGGPQDAVAEKFLIDHDLARAEQGERPRAFTSGSNGHVMLAHDAVMVVLNAVQQVEPGADPALLHDRARVVRSLRDSSYHGVAGRIEFARSAEDSENVGGDPVDKLVVVQQVVLTDDGAGLRSEYVTESGG